METNQNGQLRDFVYLDTERIRSLVAQLYEGVPELSEETKGKDKSGSGEAGLNLPIIGKLGIGGSILYQHATTETKSIHHYLYSLLEHQLFELKKVRVVDAAFPKLDDGWDSLKDGDFVLAKGHVQIIDYTTVVNGMQALPRLIELSLVFGKQGLKQQLTDKKITTKEFEQLSKSAQSSMPSKKDIEAIAEMVEKLYGGVSRVRVFPYPDDMQHQFVGTLPHQFFSVEQSSALACSGRIFGENWSAMGLVNRSSAAAQGGSAKKTQGQTMNIEEAIEEMVSAMQEIGKLTFSVEHPATAFLPIAIYRSC